MRVENRMKDKPKISAGSFYPFKIFQNGKHDEDQNINNFISQLQFKDIRCRIFVKRVYRIKQTKKVHEKFENSREKSKVSITTQKIKIRLHITK